MLIIITQFTSLLTCDTRNVKAAELSRFNPYTSLSFISSSSILNFKGFIILSVCFGEISESCLDVKSIMLDLSLSPSKALPDSSKEPERNSELN